MTLNETPQVKKGRMFSKIEFDINPNSVSRRISPKRLAMIPKVKATLVDGDVLTTIRNLSRKLINIHAVYFFEEDAPENGIASSLIRGVNHRLVISVLPFGRIVNYKVTCSDQSVIIKQDSLYKSEFTFKVPEDEEIDELVFFIECHDTITKKKAEFTMPLVTLEK